MISNWPTVNSWIGLSEGGFVNHPKDPGGATNHGITIKTLAKWRGHKVTVQDVRELTKSEAEQIIKSKYWDLVRADQLPSGIDYMASDYSVHSGPAKAAKDLQRSLVDIGVKVVVDGLIGPDTLNALGSLSKAQAQELVRKYAGRRMAFMRGLKGWKSFGNGWTRRVMGNRSGIQVDDIGVADRAMMMLDQTDLKDIPAPRPPIKPNAKAEPEQPNIVDAIQKPEAWGPLGGLVSGLGAFTSGTGPVQWAFALALVAFVAVGVFYAIKRIQTMDPA